MHRIIPLLSASLVLVAAALAVPASAALAQTEPQNRITFGGDAHVGPGEVVADVVTMGGDAEIEGTVLGDVVTMGGDAELAGSARVHGDVLTFGGEAELAPGADVSGDVTTGPGHGAGHAPFAPAVPGAPHHADSGGGLGGFVHDVLSGLVSYGLLFILGLLLMGAARSRFEGLQLTIVRKPLQSLGMGFVGILGAVVAIIVLCITIIGIPAGVLLAVALPFALYIGMAAFASVFGAALPVEKLRGKPVLQLAAGCAALYVASLVPVVGGIAVAVAALVGGGALVITRFRNATQLPPDDEPTSEGPYRTRVA